MQTRIGAKSNLKGLFNRKTQNRSNAGEKLETSKKPKLYKNSRGNLEHEKTRKKTTLDYGVKDLTMSEKTKGD